MMQVLQASFCLVSVFVAELAAAEDPFPYHFRYLTIGADIVTVERRVPGIPTGPQVLVIPRVIPMGFTQEPYDRFVGNVAAWS